MDKMTLALKKYAVFEGRAGREEYWMFVLFQVLASIAFGVLFMIAAMAGGSGDGRPNLLFGLLALLFVVFAFAMIIPGLAVTIRRLHDGDRSGWWLLLAFIPFGGIVLLIFYCLDGTPGPNKFGPDPKGRAGYGAPMAADPTLVG